MLTDPIFGKGLVIFIFKKHFYGHLFSYKIEHNSFFLYVRLKYSELFILVASKPGITKKKDTFQPFTQDLDYLG